MTAAAAEAVDELQAIWYREWVCVGVEAQVAAPGDLLPATVGDLGLHVRRTPEGALRAAFNAAQRWCWNVPAQCRGGHKIRCPNVGCGLSVDTDALSSQGGAPTGAMRKFVGSDPRRLLTAPLMQVGPMLFVSLASVVGPPDEVRPPPPDELPFGLASLGYIARLWLTLDCGWCDAQETIMELLAATGDEPPAAATLWPNLVAVELADHVAAVVVKPTGPQACMAMVALFVAAEPLAEALLGRWRRLGCALEPAAAGG